MKSGDFEATGARRCTTASFPIPLPRRRTFAAKGGSIPADERGHQREDRSDLPSRSDDLRRKLRQQRLVAGDAEAHTQLCWDNAVLMSPNQAEKLGLETGDVIEIEVKGSKLKGPIWRSRDIPTIPSPSSWDMAAPRPGASATMSASTPTRCASATRPVREYGDQEVGTGLRVRPSAGLPVHRLLRSAQLHRAAEEPAHHSRGDAGRLHQESQLRSRRG